jgi:putative Ca2+/H+ antiporter (TMEM165/GDT1 family)
MSNKVKAAAFVVAYLVVTVLAVGIARITMDYLQPTLEQLGIAFAFLLLAYAMKMMYDLRLSQLESRD